ncbi:hypothetical protein EYY97_16990 [Hafnia paralvei]|nr:hypothetical protein EYY97_16990 [Hafnia paralvei]
MRNENADQSRARAEYEKWVRAKVATARADSRPGMTTEQLRQQLHNRRGISAGVSVVSVLS